MQMGGRYNLIFTGILTKRQYVLAQIKLYDFVLISNRVDIV